MISNALAEAQSFLSCFETPPEAIRILARCGPETEPQAKSALEALQQILEPHGIELRSWSVVVTDGVAGCRFTVGAAVEEKAARTVQTVRAMEDGLETGLKLKPTTVEPRRSRWSVSPKETCPGPGTRKISWKDPVGPGTAVHTPATPARRPWETPGLTHKRGEKNEKEHWHGL
jgi:hypothetical protein